MFGPSCAFMFMCQQPAPTIVNNFSGIIIKGYDFTGLESLLLQIPSWIVPCVAMPLVGCLTTFVPALQNRKSASVCEALCNHWVGAPVC
jgi:hypothetical protein